MLEEFGYIILGCFVLFVPGFFLTLVFFPKLGQLDFWARVGASVGLGVLALIYVGMVLARPGWGMLKLTPFLAAVVALSCVCAVLAYLRGGFKVLAAYKRVVTQKIGKLRPPKPKPAPPEEMPIQPPKEEKPESGAGV